MNTLFLDKIETTTQINTVSSPEVIITIQIDYDSCPSLLIDGIVGRITT